MKRTSIVSKELAKEKRKARESLERNSDLKVLALTDRERWFLAPMGLVLKQTLMHGTVVSERMFTIEDAISFIRSFPTEGGEKALRILEHLAHRR